MRKFTQPLACSVFWLVSLLPLFLFTIDGSWPLARELRMQTRAPFPQRITLHVFREVDRWFIDRIGLRLPLVSTGAAIHVGLLQHSTDRRGPLRGGRGRFYTRDGRAPRRK